MPNDFAIIKDALSRIGAINDLETENALLRKVAEAAREFISSTGCNPNECGECDPKYSGFCCRWSGIGQALAELDKVVKKGGM